MAVINQAGGFRNGPSNGAHCDESVLSMCSLTGYEGARVHWALRLIFLRCVMALKVRGQTAKRKEKTWEDYQTHLRGLLYLGLYIDNKTGTFVCSV